MSRIPRRPNHFGNDLSGLLSRALSHPSRNEWERVTESAKTWSDRMLNTGLLLASDVPQDPYPPPLPCPFFFPPPPTPSPPPKKRKEKKSPPFPPLPAENCDKVRANFPATSC